MKQWRITQRLGNRLRRRGNAQQLIAAFVGRVRAWSRRGQPAKHHGVPEGAAALDAPAARPVATKQRRRGPFLRLRRAEGSLEQLYDAVDQAHLEWLDQFHTFLDAKDVLLEARQAAHDDDEPIPVAVASVAAMPPQAADVPDAGASAGGWDEDALGGAWEGRHGEHAS